MEREVNEVKLRIWEEIVGICTRVSAEDRSVVLHLLVQGKRCKIVFDSESKEGWLLRSIEKRILRKKIGILRTDEPRRPVAVRIINEDVAGGVCNGFD